ncbi:dihydropteroate synthase [Methanomicrobiaceae archaeon CYW5]|uniref:dihydropteroate synthase-like protein n=1 Tax=Methanovulcanius yangii TaxID=1789227 RepID=UPI0029CAA651|nr:dihydropteroate synthase-like protein [Methanovulcanius yangii]MBT8508886.1 dihydropteroate synthase [Methanovulcanius yangii]
MRCLLPTGELTEAVVRSAARGYDADVVVTGHIAAFLRPAHLKEIARGGSYDLILVSGMCTASFAAVEEELGIPVYLGPRHAVDLPLILPLLGTVELSRTVPADELLRDIRRKEAEATLADREAGADFDYAIAGCRIGGSSRMKVLAEIMDAHRREDLAAEASRMAASGADILDLGFGFDATPEDVLRCLGACRDIGLPLAADTQDPALILAAIEGGADLILSLQEENLPEVGEAAREAGIAAVVVPGGASLEENIRAAREAGIMPVIADPLLQPVGSGLVASLAGFEPVGCPLFFGAGNVTELIDADSVGVNALLAGLAHEAGAAVIFTSEHSDKTRGSVREMRRATEMMALMGTRPYPKDLGLDLMCIKEKRRRREPPIPYEREVPAGPVPETLEYDPYGNVRIGIAGGRIVAEHNGTAYTGERWDEVFYALLHHESVSLLDHAAYLGKELYKAELSLRFDRSFEQDGSF